MEQALESHHHSTNPGWMRRRRPPRRYLDPIEAPGEEDREVEIGGGAVDDKPPSAAQGASHYTFGGVRLPRDGHDQELPSARVIGVPSLSAGRLHRTDLVSRGDVAVASARVGRALGQVHDA
jgi:hypothetical protein